ncbi:unnamed protein product [Soboliphyme baturini]|uniref:Fork-head domain-containing protein n=1 Tax=Soboliphyme baturini TaxID=241478 RepID=A0A183IN47_9BILA|nr:unnamed protein product [Soboliphyme baturini]
MPQLYAVAADSLGWATRPPLSLWRSFERYRDEKGDQFRWVTSSSMTSAPLTDRATGRRGSRNLRHPVPGVNVSRATARSSGKASRQLTPKTVESIATSGLLSQLGSVQSRRQGSGRAYRAYLALLCVTGSKRLSSLIMRNVNSVSMHRPHDPVAYGWYT